MIPLTVLYIYERSGRISIFGSLRYHNQVLSDGGRKVLPDEVEIFLRDAADSKHLVEVEAKNPAHLLLMRQHPINSRLK